MSSLAFEDVTKEYRGARRYRSVREDVAGLLRRKEARGVVRALDALSLEVPEGQSFGLIGANGAGKTTALKLASRITYPTRGRVRVRGRVGALIEVGSGMHPELTGRENVHLYGRILGIPPAETKRRFDEIVAFAGVEQAIDQPVKQYSSGMQLRLGFSVAAHLEPDVLLVDEALAVGDAGFHFRCMERMRQIVNGGGTLVFVSHDMVAIETLCSRAVLLDNGRTIADGTARDIVAEYLRTVAGSRADSMQGRDVVAGDDFELQRITLHDSGGHELETLPAGDGVTVRIHYVAHRPITNAAFSVGFGDGRIGAFSIASMLIDGEIPDVISGAGHVDCTFDALPLRPRQYEIWCGVRSDGVLVRWQPLRLFQVTGDMPPGVAANSFAERAPIDFPYRWNVT